MNTNRDFQSIRNELNTYIQDNYPELYENYNDASIGSLFIDLLSHIGENIYHTIDRTVQENSVEYAQQRASLINIAKNKGIKLPNISGSVSLCDFSVQIPVLNDAPDFSYMPLILRGAQVLGSGNVFHTKSEIDFVNPKNSDGIPNRTIQPVFINGNNVDYYIVTKSEIVYSGRLKVHKEVVGQNNGFYSFFLPEKNVLSVENVTVMNGINYTTLPSLEEKNDERYRYYETEHLTDTHVFKRMGSGTNGISKGKWIKADNRFVKEFTGSGFAKITFGNGNVRFNNLNMLNESKTVLFNYLQGDINKTGLGNKIPSNSTIFTEYIVGGGIQSNLPAGAINTIGVLDLYVQGNNPSINNNVRASLKVNNIVPSYGGKEKITNEDIRNIIKYYNGYKSCISISDYFHRILTMPSKFGRPLKVKVNSDDTHVNIFLLDVNSNGNLSALINDTITTNIEHYLSYYKSYKHKLNIASGKIFNIIIKADIVVTDGLNINQIDENIRLNISTLMKRLNMGDALNINTIQGEISKITGVISVNDLKVETNYNVNENTTYHPNTNASGLIEGTILDVNQNEIFEIRNTESDIILRYATN